MHAWDFTGDEGFFFAVSAIFAVIGTAVWYLRILNILSLRRIRKWLAFLPAVALIPLVPVLLFLADPIQVVGHLDYQLLFFAGGVAWLWLTSWIIPWLGISPRDDALERRNFPAAIAVCGLLLASELIYTGGNIGGGPTIWTTLVPVGLAWLIFLALVFLLELIARPLESIAIDRDLAGAIRYAGVVTAIGLILGRSIAGDWIGWDICMSDLLRLGWPAAATVLLAIGFQYKLRPTPHRPEPPVFAGGVVPAAILIGFAVVYLVLLGMPAIGKHVITYQQHTGGK